MSTIVTNKMDVAWTKHHQSRFPLLKTYGSAFAYEITVVMVMMLIDAGIQLLGPLFLGKVVGALVNGDASDIYLWAMGLSVVTCM